MYFTHQNGPILGAKTELLNLQRNYLLQTKQVYLISLMLLIGTMTITNFGTNHKPVCQISRYFIPPQASTVT